MLTTNTNLVVSLTMNKHFVCLIDVKIFPSCNTILGGTLVLVLFISFIVLHKLLEFLCSSLIFTLSFLLPPTVKFLQKIEPTTLVDEWNRITGDKRDSDVKETLLQINIEETYEKNIKFWNSIDVKILRDTLVHLRTIDNYLFDNVLPLEQLLKTGLMYEIMKTISRVVP